MPFTVTKAAPISQRLLIAIGGPQASGKTTTALMLATGITQVTKGRITMIDSERKRGLTYAKNFDFFHIDLEAPYGPDRYDEAIRFAEAQGYANEGDVLIIDSMSHEHEGPGGVLELHEKWLDEKCTKDNGQMDWKKRDGLNMVAWNHAKKGRKRLIHYTLAQTKAHVILCFRAKEKVAMGKDDNNKTVISNDGWQPIGGEEYFFEMSIAIILPLGAAGKPDWTEKAARINEIGDGPLNRLLKQDRQVSVETGRQLAEICAAPAPVEPEKPKNPLQPLYAPILTGIAVAKTEAELWKLYHETHAATLENIKTQNANTHAGIAKKYDEKLAELQKASGIPVDQDSFFGDEQP